MKIKIEKEWCLRMAEIEEDAEIGVGWDSLDYVLTTLAPFPPASGDDDPSESDSSLSCATERDERAGTRGC